MGSVENKRRPSRIGNDPLASIIPIGETPATPEASARAERQPEPAKPTARKQSAITKHASAKPRAKKRTTLNMSNELDDAIRDAVFALSGPEVQMNLVRFVEEALAAHLKELQRAHNDGKPFPKRSGRLRTGRPLSV